MILVSLRFFSQNFFNFYKKGHFCLKYDFYHIFCPASPVLLKRN